MGDNMLDRLRNYVSDNKFELTVSNNKIHIINYSSIIILEANRIVITSDDKKICIRGNNMLLKKMLDSEILISGDFKSIELE